MKINYFTIVFLFVMLGCGLKQQKYSKELTKIFKAHGNAEAFKNVNTLSFSVNGKDVTFDLHSNKKVVNGKDFSFGFDGKKYWSTNNVTVKKPKEYIEKLSQAVLIPFSLLNNKQTDFDEDRAVLSFKNISVFYNPDTNLVESVKFKNQEVFYQEWQEIIGFKIAEKVKINNETIIFNNLELSQAVFDDRFYQKPN